MSARQIALAVDALCVLIVVSVAIALAGLTWRIAGDPGHGPRAVASVAPAPPIDLVPILALAPFGSTAPTVLSPVGGGIELRGILLAQPPSASTVLVSVGGGPTQSFALGQALPTGATVDAIELDHIVLRTGARTELLGFPNPNGGPATRNGGDPAGAGGSGPLPFSAAIPSSPPPGAAPFLAGNPTAFLDTLGVTATDGGYRIGFNPSSAMRLAGLLPGDVIEKVNGAQVGDVAQDSVMLDQAFRTGGARVEVLRGDRRITLSFPSR